MLSKFTVAAALVVATSALPQAALPLAAPVLAAPVLAEPVLAAAPLAVTPQVAATPTYTGTRQLACFDSLIGLPIVLTQIGTYLDLFFQGIGLVPTLDLPLNLRPGVNPNTPNNMATFGLLTVVQKQPLITTEYPGSNIEFFNLDSFYYGCVLPTQETIASLPRSCDITVTGFADTAGSQRVAQQTFKYRVDSLTLSKDMELATLGVEFKGLKKVEFAVADRGLIPALTTAALLDTVCYTSYTRTSTNQVAAIAAV